MADAKECDHCGELFKEAEPGSVRTNNPNEVEVRRHNGWQKPDINASIVLFRPGDRDGAIDACPRCIVLGVRKFMGKFDIKEDKGGDRFRFIPTQKGKSVLLDSVVEGEASLASRFFNAYLGKDIEVTVRVL